MKECNHENEPTWLESTQDGRDVKQVCIKCHEKETPKGRIGDHYKKILKQRSAEECHCHTCYKERTAK